MSSIVHPKADLNLLKILKSLSSCNLSSRKAYLRDEGSCLSSSFSSEAGPTSLTSSSLPIILVVRGETCSKWATLESSSGVSKYGSD